MGGSSGPWVEEHSRAGCRVTEWGCPDPFLKPRELLSLRNSSLLPRVAEQPLCLKSAVLIKLGRNSDLQGFHVFIFGVAGDLLECVPGVAP